MGWFSDSVSDLEKEIAHTLKSIEYYKASGQKSQLPSLKQKLPLLKARLAEAKRKAKK